MRQGRIQVLLLGRGRGGLGLSAEGARIKAPRGSGQIVKSEEGERFPLPSPFPYPFLPLPLPLPLPSVLLEVGPLNPARGSGERCKLPSWVWGGAPAEIEFGAF